MAASTITPSAAVGVDVGERAVAGAADAEARAGLHDRAAERRHRARSPRATDGTTTPTWWSPSPRSASQSRWMLSPSSGWISSICGDASLSASRADEASSARRGTRAGRTARTCRRASDRRRRSRRSASARRPDPTRRSRSGRRARRASLRCAPRCAAATASDRFDNARTSGPGPACGIRECAERAGRGAARPSAGAPGTHARQ